MAGGRNLRGEPAIGCESLGGLSASLQGCMEVKANQQLLGR